MIITSNPRPPSSRYRVACQCGYVYESAKDSRAEAMKEFLETHRCASPVFTAEAIER